MNHIEVIPKVELIYSPVVNYAIQQNKVPLIRRLSVENLSENELNDIFKRQGRNDWVNKLFDVHGVEAYCRT